MRQLISKLALPDPCGYVILDSYPRGGFGGSGNSRWVEESRDDEDWSKPTQANERLEQ